MQMMMRSSLRAARPQASETWNRIDVHNVQTSISQLNSKGESWQIRETRDSELEQSSTSIIGKI